MTRRCMVFILIMAVCGAVFAEGPFTITVDAVMDAFYMRKMTDDYANKDPAITGSPYMYQGDGDISSFQSSVFDDGLNGRVKFAYAGEKLGGLLEMRANTDTGIADNWYWGAWLRLGKHFRVLAGNEGQRGQVAPFHNFDDFLKTKVDYLGVLYPEYQWTLPVQMQNNFDTIEEFPYGIPGNSTTKGYASFVSTDTNDLFTPAGATSRDPLNFLLDVNFEPVTLSASLGSLFGSTSRPFGVPWITRQGGRANEYDDEYDPVVKTELNFGFRAELAQIAEMINVAAVYKYANTTLSKVTALYENNIIDEKIGNHTFGLYTTITPIADLGITVGYSGLLQQWKNPIPGNINAEELGPIDANTHWLAQYHEVAYPFYSGIDLRASYTGVEKFLITFNNNVSFANINGANNDNYEKYSNGWAYLNEINASKAAYSGIEDRSETYLGLYNALGVKYTVNDSFTADVQVANQLGIFSLDWENDTAKSITDYLGVYAGVTYTVIENENIRGSIRGGLDMRLSSFSYQNATTTDTHKAGYIDFGIPIGLKVEF